MRKTILILSAICLIGWITYFNIASSLAVVKFSKDDLAVLSYSNISTATTTYISKGSSFLGFVTINTRGTTSAICTIYDSLTATGTKVATIDLIGSGEKTFFYNVGLNTGITVSTVGTMGDITIAYK